MKIFKVTFEVVHFPDGIPILTFFHPAYHVEARSFEEAIKRAEIAFNSHEDNKTLDREIVSMEIVARPENEKLILKMEVSE